MRAGAHNPLATDAGDNTVTDYHLIRREEDVNPVDSYYKTKYISSPPFAEDPLKGDQATYHTH